MIIVLLLAAASPPDEDAAPVTDAQIELARTTLEEGLRDYSGARLRGFRAVRTTKALALCGQANLPNAMGGMTGWQDIGVVLDGRSSALPNIRVLGSNGLDGYIELASVCPTQGSPYSQKMGAVYGQADVTLALQPVGSASPR